jgi:Bacterial Ig-like domain (group 2)
MSKQIVINLGCCRKKKCKPWKRFVFRWATGIQSFVEGYMARITTEEQVAVSVEPKTAAGRPAAIDGDVVWSSDNENVATVTSTGPNSAMVKSVAKGAAVISAVFDADLDVGELREIILTGAIEVVDAEAVTGELVFGTPELTPLP